MATNLTNLGTLTSSGGDVLDLTPLTYNGAQLATLADIANGSVTGGDGIDVTSGEVSVDLYTTQVTAETLNIIGLNPVIDGAYTFLRNGCINGNIFYDQPTPRVDAPQYAMFVKPDGPNWDIVYADDVNAWHAGTVNTNPATWTQGDTVLFTTSVVYVAAEAPPVDYQYDTGSGIYRAPQELDPNVSYTAGSGTVAESYLEFINGKLRVNITELQSALNIPPTPAQTYFAVPFTFSDTVVPIAGLAPGYSVTDVRLIMDVPFDAAGSIEVGTSLDNGMLVDGLSFDVQSVDAQLEFGWHDVTSTDYNIYITPNGATVGAGRVLVQVVGGP